MSILDGTPQQRSDNRQENGKMLAPGVLPEGHEPPPEDQELAQRAAVNLRNNIYNEKAVDGWLNFIDTPEKIPVAAAEAVRKTRTATVEKNKRAFPPWLNNGLANLAVGELSTLVEKRKGAEFKLNPEQKKKAVEWVIGAQLKKDAKDPNQKGLGKQQMTQFLMQEGPDEVKDYLIKSGGGNSRQQAQPQAQPQQQGMLA